MHTNLTINEKSIDGVLGTQTRGGMMVGENESTELSHIHKILGDLSTISVISGFSTPARVLGQDVGS